MISMMVIAVFSVADLCDSDWCVIIGLYESDCSVQYNRTIW